MKDEQNPVDLSSATHFVFPLPARDGFADSFAFARAMVEQAARESW